MLTKKQVVWSTVALIIVIAILFVVYTLNQDRPTEGEKELVINIIHADESKNSLNVKTDELYLRYALEGQGIISGLENAYGLFVTTVDGETADSSLEQWWKISKDGELLMTGVDTTVIVDGDTYDFEFVTGFE